MRAFATAATAAVAAALLVGGCGGASQPVSDADQEALPTIAYTLVQDLCFRGASTADRALQRRVRAQAQREFAALERSLSAQPDATVEVTIATPATQRSGVTTMTVRELAQTHADDALSGLRERARCERAGLARLRRALRASER